MPFTNNGKNSMLDDLGITQVSLHTASPGETGTNEVSGGGYARQSITFGAAASGAIDSSNQPAFSVPAATTVTHVGFWASTTFVAWADVTDETFSNAGTYTLTDADLSIT